ncbi:MAG: recombination protein NinB [Rhizobiaceae bacterium]
MKQTFILQPAHHPARSNCINAVLKAPDGRVVTIAEPTRTTEQNARFHAMVGDFAKSGLEWAGKKRNAQAWKVLLISAHATATKEGSEIVPGLEGEFVNLRESSALMSIKRGCSLIDYTQAYGDTAGVKWSVASLGGEVD